MQNMKWAGSEQTFWAIIKKLREKERSSPYKVEGICRTWLPASLKGGKSVKYKMKKKKLTLLGCALFLVAVATPAAAWVANPDNGHIYDLISSPNNFYQAENIAQTEYGAHLVTISDANENQWLVDTFGTTQAWIGFTDDGHEGNWVWITGEPTTFTNWWRGEPNNRGWHGPENFAFINYGAPGRWNDVANGDFRYPFHALIERSTPVPLPGAAWLLGSGLVGLAGMVKKKSRC